MRERDIERYLKQQVEKAGGLAWKFTSPGTQGVPDRVVVLNRRVYFVEVKATGQKLTKMQIHRLTQLSDRGALTTWVDSKEDIDALVKHIGELDG